MKTVVKDLKLIIIGTLLVIFDFHYKSTTNGIGFKIDLINDLIGAIMICIATFRIFKVEMKNKAYYKHMRFATIASVLLILVAIDDFFIYSVSTTIAYIKAMLTIFLLIGILLFFAAMTYFTEEKQLENAFGKMKTARNLIFWMHVLPITVLTIANFQDSLIKFQNPFVTLLLMVIFFLPIFYGLYAIQVTRRELRNK